MCDENNSWICLQSLRDWPILLLPLPDSDCSGTTGGFASQWKIVKAQYAAAYQATTVWLTFKARFDGRRMHFAGSLKGSAGDDRRLMHPFACPRCVRSLEEYVPQNIFEWSQKPWTYDMVWYSMIVAKITQASWQQQPRGGWTWMSTEDRFSLVFFATTRHAGALASGWRFWRALFGEEGGSGRSPEECQFGCSSYWLRLAWHCAAHFGLNSLPRCSQGIRIPRMLPKPADTWKSRILIKEGFTWIYPGLHFFVLLCPYLSNPEKSINVPWQRIIGKQLKEKCRFEEDMPCLRCSAASTSNWQIL